MGRAKQPPPSSPVWSAADQGAELSFFRYPLRRKVLILALSLLCLLCFALPFVTRSSAHRLTMSGIDCALSTFQKSGEALPWNLLLSLSPLPLVLEIVLISLTDFKLLNAILEYIPSSHKWLSLLPLLSGIFVFLWLLIQGRRGLSTAMSPAIGTVITLLCCVLNACATFLLLRKAY